MTGEIAQAVKETGGSIGSSPVTPERLAGLARAVDRGTISASLAKTVFEKMFATGAAAEDIIAAEGLAQIDDEGALMALVDGVIGGHPDAVTQYRRGKTGTFGFLVGQVMKAAAGKANPGRVNELLRRALERGPAGSTAGEP